MKGISMGEQSPAASIRIDEVRENPLLNRKEVLFTLLHEGRSTPSRWTIRQSLAQLLKAPLDCVIVKSITTRTGAGKASGHAHVYENGEEAMRVEPRYVYVRNLPPEERTKVVKAAVEKAKKERPKKGERGAG